MLRMHELLRLKYYDRERLIVKAEVGLINNRNTVAE